MYFFPSCKVQQQFPQTSRRLQAYLQERWQLLPQGCCRLNRQVLQTGDVAITICNTCTQILSASAQVQSLWQLIDQDEKFPFPDYQGEVMTVQDCWLSADQPELQQAVRSLLHKMNISIRELPDNFAQTRFCGVKVSQQTLQLAPQLATRQRSQMTPEERADHLAKTQTAKVVCYCRPCLNEINAAGHKGQHLLKLLFPGQD